MSRAGGTEARDLGSRFPKEGKKAGIGADRVEISVGSSHCSIFLRIKCYGFAEGLDSRIRLLLEGIGTGFVVPGCGVVGFVLEGLVIAGDPEGWFYRLKGKQVNPNPHRPQIGH